MFQASTQELLSTKWLQSDPIRESIDGRIYVKSDLEGHEIFALHGACKLLERDDIIQLITLEQRAMDFFEIPELLYSYKQKRSHLYCHDTEIFMDFVLYAEPAKFVLA